MRDGVGRVVWDWGEERDNPDGVRGDIVWFWGVDGRSELDKLCERISVRLVLDVYKLVRSLK